MAAVDLPANEHRKLIGRDLASGELSDDGSSSVRSHPPIRWGDWAMMPPDSIHSSTMSDWQVLEIRNRPKALTAACIALRHKLFLDWRIT